MSTVPKLVLAVVLAGAPGGERVRIELAVEPGTVVHKHFSGAVELALTEAWLDLECADRWDLAYLGALSVGEMRGELTVVDRYARIADGRPLELVREHDQLGARWTQGDSIRVWDAERAFDWLRWREVAFARDAPTDEWTRRWADGGGEDERLDGLAADLDFLALLPDRRVRPGARWWVPWTDMGPVLAPGGHAVHLSRDLWGRANRILEAGVAEAFRGWFGDAEVWCEFVGVERHNGVRVARIAIEADRAGSVDLALALSEDPALAGWPSGDLPSWAEGDLRIDGAGELLWNLDAGRFERFELELRIEVEVHAPLSFGASLGGVDARIEGLGRWTAEAEQEDEP